jgi:hypothetical protein
MAERPLMVNLFRSWGLPEPAFEVRFDRERRWRLDVVFDCVAWKVGLEIEGLQGRHQTVAGFLADMEKYNRAVLAGYRLIRTTWRDIESGAIAVVLLEACGLAVAAAREEADKAEAEDKAEDNETWPEACKRIEAEAEADAEREEALFEKARRREVIEAEAERLQQERVESLF